MWRKSTLSILLPFRRVATCPLRSVRRFAASHTTEGVPSDPVLINSEPEFEGEVLSAQPTGKCTPPSPVDSTSSTANVKKVGDGVSFSTLASCLAMGLQQRMQHCDSAKVDAVAQAYEEFFNHIRFRNGWAEPPFKREEVHELLHEAADIVVRIRSFLDRKDAATKLRKLDGEAQAFLHSPAAAELFRNAPRKFVLRLIDATFRDAIGYVEGLSRSLVETYVREILTYQYHPRVHAMHLLAKLEQSVASARLSSERGAAASATDDVGLRAPWTRSDVVESTTENYCADAGEKKRWGDVIKHLYNAMDALEIAQSGATEAPQTNSREQP